MLEVRGIDVSYGDVQVLWDVSLEVNKGEIVALIKPQFEVGKGEVGRGGIVTDPTKHRLVLDKIREAAVSIGFDAVGLIESPILGAEGNREFLLYARWN